MDLNKIFAKSKNNGGMTLLEHLNRCAVSCYENAINVGASEYVSQMSFIAGLFHDLGKCKQSFQKYLNGGDYEEHVVSSAFIFDRYVNIKDKDNSSTINYKEYIVRSILYHHPCDENFSKNYEMEKFFNKLDKQIIDEFIVKLIDIYKKYFKKNQFFSLSLSKGEDISYDVSYFCDNPSCSNVKNKESRFFIILNVLRFSDIISSYEKCPVDLNTYLYNGLYKSKKKFVKPNDYDDRFYEQLEKAKLLSSKDFSILDAPTGFGKTMLGVIYLLSNDKKGYWVCPRNSIAESVYKTVKNEVHKLGFEKKISVGLLLTNEYKFGDKNSDIIVTNIDNYVRPFLKNDVKDLSMNMIYNNIIFDEFHEYVDPQLYSMFCSIVSARSSLKGVKTMLMSATMPPFNATSFFYKYFYLKDYCLITRQDIKHKIITDKKYKIIFADTINGDVCGKSTLVNLNSVISSQLFYNSGWADCLIHSRFTDEDLDTIKKKLYKNHAKTAIRKSKNVYENTSYSSTNMISTGVDVSFSNLIYNYVQPDRLIQLIGRVNRFSECNMDVPTITLSNSDFNKQSEIMGVNMTYKNSLSDKFYNFLKNNIHNGDIVRLDYLYDLRDKFYTDYAYDINMFMNTVEKDSFKHLSDLTYSRNNYTDNTDTVYISNKISLRNDGSVMKFWGIFKDINTRKMTSPIQVDDMIIRDNFLSEDKNINEAFKYIEKNDLIKNYFGNKYIFKNIKSSKSKCKELLLRKAICDKTPFPILKMYKYSKKLGIFKEDKIKI